jgi:hypothetical protein
MNFPCFTGTYHEPGLKFRLRLRNTGVMDPKQFVWDPDPTKSCRFMRIWIHNTVLEALYFSVFSTRTRIRLDPMLIRILNADLERLKKQKLIRYLLQEIFP